VTIWMAAILLIAAVGLFVAAPLSDQVLGDGSSTSSGQSERCEHEHGLAVQALRELEFDHAMGKLDAGDYRALKEKLENRALAAMARREQAPRPSPSAPAAPVAASPQSISPARIVALNFCPQCGTRAGAAHKFCANCGAALNTTAAVLK
jgi:cytochrome c-type biogenesis protein CcmI